MNINININKKQIQKIKDYVKKEAIFQNLQNNKKQAEIALEILLRTGFIDISELIHLKDTINKKIAKIIKEKDLLN